MAIPTYDIKKTLVVVVTLPPHLGGRKERELRVCKEPAHLGGHWRVWCSVKSGHFVPAPDGTNKKYLKEFRVGVSAGTGIAEDPDNLAFEYGE